jgi:YbbR domain-containing protein
MNGLQNSLKVLKEYARDYILENTGLKVLALFITAVLWLSVAARFSQTTFNPVPIEFSNLSSDLTLSKYDTVSAKVFLRGPKDVIDSLRSSDLAVVADLQNVEPGVRVIPLKLDAQRLPPSIDSQNIDIEPRSVRLTIERLVETELPVQPRLEGEVPPGYEIYGWNINPSKVKVTAAASHMKEISSVSTETVTISGKTSTFSQSVAIDTGSPNVSTMEENPRVMLTINIGEARKERVFDKVPVTLINATTTAQAEPKFVRLTILGAPSVVDALTLDEIEVTVDYAAALTTNHQAKPEVQFANNSDKLAVKVIEPNTIRIK